MSLSKRLSHFRFEPAEQRLRSTRTGRVVCKCCRKAYGSDFDGLCTACRGGVTAWEAQQRAAGVPKRKR